MNIAAQYARALFTAADPSVARLRAALARRGHERLLPRIAAEYEKLQLHAQRLAAYMTETPDRRRTRVLLQLYRQLTR